MAGKGKKHCRDYTLTNHPTCKNTHKHKHEEHVCFILGDVRDQSHLHKIRLSSPHFPFPAVYIPYCNTMSLQLKFKPHCISNFQQTLHKLKQFVSLCIQLTVSLNALQNRFRMCVLQYFHTMYITLGILQNFCKQGFWFPELFCLRLDLLVA